MACKFGDKIAPSSIIAACNHSHSTSLECFLSKIWNSEGKFRVFSPCKADGSQEFKFVYIFQMQIGCASISKEHPQVEQGEGRSQNPSQI